MMNAMSRVVLLHGFTNTAASWAPVVAELGETYSAAAIDIRGHGGASAAEPLTLDAVLADIGAAAAAPFTLVGYSMGGRLALHAAMRSPEQIRTLILVSSSPGISDPEERIARREADARLADRIERLSIEQFADEWSELPVLAGLSDELRAAARIDRLRNHPPALARALRCLGPGALPSLWDQLGNLGMPVTILAGERDPKFTRIAWQMATAIPEVAVEIVPGAGHAIHLETPTRVVAAIRARRS
jgi:2-succinyl-6-hydroxy-2,4-cyclohexadiene-1-carboxylate synthase